MQHEEMNERAPLRNGSAASNLPAACRSQEGKGFLPWQSKFTVRLLNGFKSSELENPSLLPLQIKVTYIKKKPSNYESKAYSSLKRVHFSALSSKHTLGFPELHMRYRK